MMDTVAGVGPEPARNALAIAVYTWAQVVLSPQYQQGTARHQRDPDAMEVVWRVETTVAIRRTGGVTFPMTLEPVITWWAHRLPEPRNEEL